MKIGTPKQALEVVNEDYMRKHLQDAPIQESADGLLLLLGQLFDHIAGGGDAYLTFTANRKRTELLLTLGIDGEKTYVTAGTISGLLNTIQHLL